MGKIFTFFGNLTVNNEASVSQNFVIPLLTRFLGYRRDEIIPEKYFPAFDFYSGVKKIGNSKSLKQKPDYVICLNGDFDQSKFVFDSKKPNENLDSHLDQLKSYALGARTNLLVISNGSALKIYDVNNLIFVAQNIDDLDIKFRQLESILSRKSQASKNLVEIIQNIDLSQSLLNYSKSLTSKKLKLLEIELSDFIPYLGNITFNYKDWHISLKSDFFNMFPIEKFSPENLFYFKPHEASVIALHQGLQQLPLLAQLRRKKKVVVTFLYPLKPKSQQPS